MTGFGSPCGACKFLRRKCVRGCVFAPYFCHEQGAAHFAAIHKVFGASNFSKILMHLPVADRSEAAVTVSYEAQARLQDPVYGCVAHIFALQQQVVNLQAQLASLRAQAAQGLGSSTAADRTPREDKPPPYHQDNQSFFRTADGRTPPPFSSTPSMDLDNVVNSRHYDVGSEHISFDDGSFAMASPGMQASSWSSAYHHDMEDLQSVALAYLGRS
ncbi:LOB domain-containing protein CRL1-like [Musa acuminata AAA Group]|uniref:LOB domain-containing protein CRL1-like n=1 Tax=Musa acuminata AAA Group TaxID=214697 RepID=UPI0031D5BBE3